jgi:ABC-type cobalamin/Fe3+-siderophores transport system ATPase subunit
MAMKIKDEQGNTIPYKGLSPHQYQELTTLINRCLETKPYVVICIKGNKGVGKTTLAKYMRKYGFGPFRAKDVAVIDDDCMSVDVLGIFRRKYYNPCNGVDELEPFFKYCKNKRIRCYVKANPESRITFADILIEVETDERKRRHRLLQRYDPQRAKQVIEQSKHYTHQPKIAYQYELIAEID